MLGRALSQVHSRRDGVRKAGQPPDRPPRCNTALAVLDHASAIAVGIVAIDFCKADDDLLLPLCRRRRRRRWRSGRTDALFFAGFPIPCVKAADADDSNRLDVSDALYILNFLFLGGPQPAVPFEECGSDPSEDAFSCEGFAPCA